MKATLLATITFDDGIWTVSLHESSDKGQTMLRFVRDRAFGGHERIVVPISEPIARSLVGCPLGALGPRLEAELRAALVHDADEVPVH